MSAFSVAAGTGSPEGVVTAVAGSIWLQTDDALGAILWIKATGTGNTGWLTRFMPLDTSVNLGEQNNRFLNIYLHGILQSSDSSGVDLYYYTDVVATCTAITMYRARGTEGSPLPVRADDPLGRIAWRGSVDTYPHFDYAAAKILCEAAEDHSPAHQGARLRFATTNKLQASDSYKWDMDSEGAWYPDADNVFDIGLVDTKRVRDLYLNRRLHLGTGGYVVGTASAGFVIKNSSDIVTNFQVSDDGTIRAGGTWYPASDNVFDIGLVGTNRVRDVYLNRILHLGAGGYVVGTASSGFVVKNSSDIVTNFQVSDDGTIVAINAAGATVRIASATGAYMVGGNPVVGARKTGWTSWTGTPDRTSHATGAATLTNVAEALKALIDDLTSHGLIGT